MNDKDILDMKHTRSVIYHKVTYPCEICRERRCLYKDCRNGPKTEVWRSSNG